MQKRQIKGIIFIVLYLLFLVWVKSWLGLILLPFLIDIYFTRFIPWGFWRKFTNPIAKTLFSWFDAILFALVAVYFVNIFVFQNYQIPTSSLEKSLLVGDHLFVSKLSYGPRIPNTPIALPIAHNTLPSGGKSYFDSPHWDYKRVKGLGEIQRNDIVVFNYPSGDTVASDLTNVDFYRLAYEIGYNVNKNVPLLDSMSTQEQRDYFESIYAEGRKVVETLPQYYGDIMSRPVDRRDNYVKRCLALPGDTLQIIDSKVYIDGKLNPDAPDVQFNYYVQTTGPRIPEKVFKELGINNDDKYLFRRDVRVEDKASNNQVIYHAEGLNNEDLEKVINKYSNSARYAVLVINGTEANFLNQEGFDSNGFRADDKFIYKIPLTKEMYQTLKVNTALISKIIQEPNTARIADANYQKLLIYPLDGYTQWDKNDYGPIWVPKKGETIELSLENLPIYERCIAVYEGNKLEVKDGKIYINQEQTDKYTFKMSYYWMMGDNRDNSLDSRYWGFVPEDHIVGKPLFIWLSLEKDNGWFDGKIRWNRFFKWVK